MTEFAVRVEPNGNLFSKRKRVLLLQQTGSITFEEYVFLDVNASMKHRPNSQSSDENPGATKEKRKKKNIAILYRSTENWAGSQPAPE